MRNILSHLEYAQIRISRSIDLSSKVAYALLNLSQLVGIGKKAYRASDIETAIKQHFRAEGLENPPDINWGHIFKGVVAKMAIGNGWTKEHEEDILASVFQDVLLGENLDTGGKWSQGNLANVIRELRSEGKDDIDITKILKRQVKQEAWKKSENRRKYMPGAPDAVGQYYFDPTLQKDKEDAQGLVLDLLDLNPFSRGQAQNWMSMINKSPDQGIMNEEVHKAMKNVFKTINQKVQRRADWGTALVWNAIKDSPNYGTRKALGEKKVTFRDPESKRIRTAPLYVALGKAKPTDIWYELKKLQKLLSSVKPQAMKVLHEVG